MIKSRSPIGRTGPAGSRWSSCATSPPAPTVKAEGSPKSAGAKVFKIVFAVLLAIVLIIFISVVIFFVTSAQQLG